MKFFLAILLIYAPVQCSRAATTSPRLIEEACERVKYKDCSLVKAIIQHESSGNPLAIGHDGAGSLGLMQIKCSTAWTLDRNQGRRQIECKKLFDPRINIYYGIEYLRHIQDLLTHKPNMQELLSAYNGGYRYDKHKNEYLVKHCNAISIKKKRKCKKGEPFNIEYSRKVIQIYDQLKGGE